MPLLRIIIAYQGCIRDVFGPQPPSPAPRLAGTDTHDHDFSRKDFNLIRIMRYTPVPLGGSYRDRGREREREGERERDREGGREREGETCACITLYTYIYIYIYAYMKLVRDEI